ncbi:hypothetical protein JTE90_029679 [Oedothorax gibbosus]|uniref:Uncharacterized protein n=1 Tax=Oedothorax gibbosus TaxID=931172 RepID=A0AAV6TZT3_9ARAC|nr:hypothetical protein JTE90_029679 [Oedothorax gibbosus]
MGVLGQRWISDVTDPPHDVTGNDVTGSHVTRYESPEVHVTGYESPEVHVTGYDILSSFNEFEGQGSG